MSSRFLSPVRKCFINIFILLALWIMVANNARLALPTILPSVYPQQDPDHPVSKINWYIGRLDWWVKHVGWIVGLKNYWRMFSPVDRFNWYMEFSAVHQNGQEVILPLPHQTRRTFWERHLTDFREAKFHLNIYNDEAGKKFYAQYLCRVHQNEDNPVSAIKIDLYWQKLLDPGQPRIPGVYFERRYKRPWGLFVC